jgi:1-acyl-sn-glycerol-3-phosphate acyltransferase
VDRKDAQSRAEVYTKCAERIREGKSIVIFPEGGVTDDISVILQDFRNGAFSMAVEHQIEILVYTFIDLKYMFPFDNSKGYPANIKVYFNGILSPNGETLESLKNKSYQMIYNTLTKN